jgi:hypothetical protein
LKYENAQHQRTAGFLTRMARDLQFSHRSDGISSSFRKTSIATAASFMMSASSFALELLDTESGHVLQTWDLGGADVFQLGRSKDCDVEFGSPFVSRTHAWIQIGADGWELSPVSRSGVFVDGQRIERLILADGVVFRLADRGPLLRFRAAAPAGSGTAKETICFDQMRTPLLIVDEQQRDREVGEIAEGAYFQELQKKLARLRSRPPGGTQESA